MIDSFFHFTLPSSDILIRYNLQILAHHQSNQMTRHPVIRGPITSQNQQQNFNNSNSIIGQSRGPRWAPLKSFDRGISGCRKLKSIELAHCFSVSDNGVIALTRACPMLEKIDLEGCSLITDLTLAQLSVNCPNLTTLIVSHCDQITDDGIAKLTTGMCEREHLINLAMDNCPLITDMSLDYLSKKCRQLKRLDLFDCQLITQRGISNYQDLSPSIQIQAYFAPDIQTHRRPYNFRRLFRCCNLI